MPMNETASLFKEIEKTFPFVDKPNGLALLHHKVGCFNCEMVRRDLETYSKPELPKEALRYLHNEMGCLSAKGWRWVLPSYLRYCVGVNDTYDGLETEYLIYTLGPDLKYQKETFEHLSELTGPQIDCLIHFLGWCSAHPHWSDYCPKDIQRAIAFMQTYRHNNFLQPSRFPRG